VTFRNKNLQKFSNLIRLIIKAVLLFFMTYEHNPRIYLGSGGSGGGTELQILAFGKVFTYAGHHLVVAFSTNYSNSLEKCYPSLK
jgi:hypothetical protein